MMPRVCGHVKAEEVYGHGCAAADPAVARTWTPRAQRAASSFFRRCIQPECFSLAVLLAFLPPAGVYDCSPRSMSAPAVFSEVFQSESSGRNVPLGLPWIPQATSMAAGLTLRPACRDSPSGPAAHSSEPGRARCDSRCATCRPRCGCTDLWAAGDVQW